MGNGKVEIKTNTLKYLYDTYRKGQITEEQIDNEDNIDFPLDITEHYHKYIDEMLQHKRLITMQFNGEVRDGKSTAALAEMCRINEKIMKLKGKKIDMYKTIVSDQNEFVRFSKTSEENICCEIDEFNALGATGSNATTEIAEMEFIANVCAAQYIHRISCQPQGNIDPNITVFMEVEGRDDKNKVTRCRLYYKDIAIGERMYLGKVYIYVDSVLKSDWYRKYEEKKKQRIHLLQSHGMRDIRQIEQGYMERQVFAKLSTRVHSDYNFGKVNPESVKIATIEIFETIFKRPSSTIHRDEIVQNVNNALSILWRLKRIQVKIETETSDTKKLDLQRIKESMNSDLLDQIRRWDRISKLYTEYLNIQ